MPNIKDVAKEAEVSIATVSNAISGTKRVSAKLRQRVFAAIDKLGYEVNTVASSLKSKKTNTIGIIIPNINRIFFPQVMRGIQDGLFPLGYNLMLCDTNDDIKKELFLVQTLKNSWADGIIIGSVADEDDHNYVNMLSNLSIRGKSIPVVLLEREFAHSKISSVRVDNYQAGRMATRHLLESGCKHILHIAGPRYSCMVNARIKGYTEELQSEDSTMEPIILEGDFSPLSGYQAIKNYPLKQKQIDGIFAANDQMAIGAINALKENGYDIPDDIKVIGFDNTFVASIVEPAVTTINVPKYKMGLAAAKLLVKQINKPESPAQNIMLPVNLMVRSSTQFGGDRTWELFGW